MSFESVLAEDRRLVILRSLSETPGYELNEQTLALVLRNFAHWVSRDQVRADLAWLRERALITTHVLRPQSGELWVARLTDDGDGVANGRACPGVARRTPGD